MEHSKPKVTIDLDEYNQLLALKNNNDSLDENIKAKAIGIIVNYTMHSSSNPMSGGFSVSAINNLLLKSGINAEFKFVEDKIYLKSL